VKNINKTNLPVHVPTLTGRGESNGQDSHDQDDAQGSFPGWTTFEGQTIDLDTNEFGYVMEVPNPLGMTTSMVVKASEVSGPGIVRRLYDAGMPYVLGNQDMIPRWLMLEASFASGQVPIVLLASSLGWLKQSRDIFLTPGETITWLDLPEDRVQIQRQRQAASYEQVNQPVGGLSHSIDILKDIAGHPGAMFLVLASLASPLIAYLDQPGFTVNCSHSTSTGKSSALQIAASMWGNPDPAQPWSMLQNFDGKMLSVETVLAGLNHLPYIVDDTKRAREAELKDILYMLPNGEGKMRHGSIDHHWRNISVMAGERSLSHYVRGHEGAIARAIDFDLAPFGEKSPEMGQRVSQWVEACRANYGWVGPLLIEDLMDQRHHVHDRYDQLCELYHGLADDQVATRQAGYYAVIHLAGEILERQCGLGNSVAEVVRAVWENAAPHRAQVDQALMALQAVASWIEEVSDCVARSTTDIIERADQVGDLQEQRVRIVTRKLDELLVHEGFNPRHTVEAWNQQGLLTTNPGRRSASVRLMPDGWRTRAYVFHRGTLEERLGRTLNL